MTADYFTALASRAIHPEQGIQPRGRTMFDAPDPAVREPGLVDVATESSIDAIEAAPEQIGRLAPSARHLGNAEADASEAADQGTPAHDGSPATITDRSHAPHLDPSRDAGELQPESAQAPIAGRRVTVHAAPLAPLSPVPVPAVATPRPRQFVDIAPAVRRTGDERRRETGASHGAADSSTEAIVRVHIGRVDVRAVMQPPAAPSTRSSKQSLMSLEDYVRKRKDGRP